jgi:hypothetical protein
MGSPTMHACTLSFWSQEDSALQNMHARMRKKPATLLLMYEYLSVSNVVGVVYTGFFACIFMHVVLAGVQYLSCVKLSPGKKQCGCEHGRHHHHTNTNVSITC